VESKKEGEVKIRWKKLPSKRNSTSRPADRQVIYHTSEITFDHD
jgi:hypothetical protein